MYQRDLAFDPQRNVNILGDAKLSFDLSADRHVPGK